MKKLLLLFFCFISLGFTSAQIFRNYELNAGVVSRKTQKLYWENGLGADFTSDWLLNKKIHIKSAFVTSVLGSANGSNALKQESFTLGADWRFFSKRSLQVFTGLNAGVFLVQYEDPKFDVLPNSSMLFQFESGLVYHFVFPLSVSASFGYNIINSNGENGPGTLFPVFYELKAYYRIKN